MECTSIVLALPQTVMERRRVSFEFNISQENNRAVYSSIMAEIMAAGDLDAFMAYCDHVYQSPTIDVSLLRVTTDIEFLSIEYVDDTLTVAFFDLNTPGNLAEQRRSAYPNATRRARSRGINFT